MDIYIKWNDDKESLRLPVLPSSFELAGTQNNTSVNIHNLGELNLKGKRNLYTISFDSFFPCQHYEFCRCKPKSIESYIKTLRTLFENNTTVHLIITESEVNMFCTIDSFNHGMSEKVQDVSYSLSFVEYRSVTEGTRVVKSTVSTTKTTTHKWKKGDTWQKVTKKYLGSSKKWKTVKKNNASVIKKAKKKNKGKKEKVALIGYKVVVKA